MVVALAQTPALSAETGAATRPAAAARQPAPLLDRLRALGLPQSTGRITAHHAAGHEATARRLRELVEAAMAFYRDRLGIEAPLHMAVLTREQWEGLIVWQPYGIPGVAGNPPVIFLPATDDGLAAQDALSLRERASPAALALLASSGLSFDEAARRHVDLVGLHELGHAYVRAFGIQPPSRWLDEWLATYLAYAFMRERSPASARLWEAVLQVYVDAVQPAHTSLADFDRLYFGVGAQNYVWYQAQFQRRVASAYEAHGVGLIPIVRDALAVSAAEPLTPAAMLDRLERRLPGFRAWAAELDAPAPAPRR